MDTANLEDLEEMVESFSKSELSKLGRGMSKYFLSATGLSIAQLFGDYREPGAKVDKIVRDPYYG
jgi:uncharacterized protein YaaN involved in tellurite resistance